MKKLIFALIVFLLGVLLVRKPKIYHEQCTIHGCYNEYGELIFPTPCPTPTKSVE